MQEIHRQTLQSIQDRLKLSPYGKKWRLDKLFYYDIGRKGSGERIKVEKGFITDGASIPRIFHIIGTPMDTDTIIGAVIHDKLYKTQVFKKKPITREKADEIFNEIMILTGVNKVKRVLYYLGVRIGGKYTRDKYTKLL